MKSFTFVAAAVAAIAAVSPASGAKCVLTDLVAELQPITAMVYACYDATGYAVIPPRANPTAEQSAAVCAKCPEMIATAKTMTFNTCFFTVSGVDIPLNEWVPKIIGACDATSSATSASSGSSSAAPAVGSGTNATSTTTAPAAGAAAASSNSGSGSSAASSNSVTTPTPTPTGTQSSGVVASLSVATTAVAVGSIAAFLL